MYYKYFKYVLEHKKNVFIECMSLAKEYWNETYWKKDNRKIAKSLFLHAFIHDLSKFLPCEFIPYAKYFYGKNKTLKIVDNFENAWEHHYEFNKHHPEYWEGKDMPMKYIRFMVCDLKAMSRKFGGTAQKYYLENYFKWDITHETRHRLEIALDLIKEYNAPICECNEEYYQNIYELIVDSEEYFKKNGEISKGTVKENINNFLKPACERYNLDIYELVQEARCLEY